MQTPMPWLTVTSASMWLAKTSACRRLASRSLMVRLCPSLPTNWMRLRPFAFSEIDAIEASTPPCARIDGRSI